MKQVILLAALLLSFYLTVQAQTISTERQLIENTIQLYFDGWATGDSAKIGKAMHASCHLKNYRDGKFIEYSKKQYLSLLRPRISPNNLQTRLVSVDITDNMGSAKVEISTGEDLFTDYFNLMKTSEGWVIADKVSTHKPHKTFDINVIRPEKEIVFEGLRRPWSIAFMTEQDALVSEKDGDLVKINLLNKEKTKINGFPSDMSDSLIGFGDNTGRFEVILDPDFSKNKFIYLSYAAQRGNLRTTKIIRATLSGSSLKDIKTLFVAEPYTSERYHYGGGMAFGNDGKLYFTIGERLFTEKDQPLIPIAQNIQDKRGKIYRINSDGTIPVDNPDFGSQAVPGLYASGIRAAQGITVHKSSGTLWFTEHGTHQGDEINILKAGANYGWPVRTTGKYRYADFKPQSDSTVNYTDPLWYWPQTVAPTGLQFYSGNEFEIWNGNLIVGGLSRGSLWRMVIEGEKIISAEELFTDSRLRIRKVAQSPAGKLYLLSDEMNGKVIRIKNSSN